MSRSLMAIFIALVIGCAPAAQPASTSPPPATSPGATPAPTATTEPWPTGPVTLIVPLDAGSGLDAIVRPIAAQLATELGVPVRVDNRPGGGTSVGTTSLFNEPDDGTVILTVNTTQLSLSSLRTGTYKLDDFYILGGFENLHGGTFVVPQSPYHSAADLLRGIRDNPGQISMAHTGGSEALLAAQLRDAGLDLRDVQFEGAAQARTAALARDVDFFQSGFEPTLSVVAPGEFIPLAVLSRQRLPEHPDVPTMYEALAELGINDITLTEDISRLFLIQPSFAQKYPQRLEILLDALERAVNSPAVKAFSDETGANIKWSPADEVEEAARTIDELFLRYEDLFK